MDFYIALAVIVMLIAILVFTYFVCITNLKKYQEKIDKAEEIIDENLNKKLDLVNTLNNTIKKVTGKKDYLKDYTSIKNLNITNIEKDMKLNEGIKLIDELTGDYRDLNKDKDFMKTFNSLRELDEVLVSAKNLFNQNAVKLNQLIKKFPYNIVAKIANYRIRSFYTTNKTDDGDNF